MTIKVTLDARRLTYFMAPHRDTALKELAKGKRRTNCKLKPVVLFLIDLVTMQLFVVKPQLHLLLGLI
jgi:hypothetical protein